MKAFLLLLVYCVVLLSRAEADVFDIDIYDEGASQYVHSYKITVRFVTTSLFTRRYGTAASATLDALVGGAKIASIGVANGTEKYIEGSNIRGYRIPYTYEYRPTTAGATQYSVSNGVLQFLGIQNPTLKYTTPTNTLQFLQMVQVGLPIKDVPYKVLNEDGGTHTIDLFVDGQPQGSTTITGGAGTYFEGKFQVELETGQDINIGVDGTPSAVSSSSTPFVQDDVGNAFTWPAVATAGGGTPPVAPTTNTPPGVTDIKPDTPTSNPSGSTGQGSTGDIATTGSNAGTKTTGTGAGMPTGTTVAGLNQANNDSVDKTKAQLGSDGVPKQIPRNAPGMQQAYPESGPSLMRFDVNWGTGHKQVSLDPLDYPDLVSALEWFKRIVVRVSAALFLAWVYKVMFEVVQNYGSTSQTSVMQGNAEVIPGVPTAMTIARTATTVALCVVFVTIALCFPVLISSWMNWGAAPVDSGMVSSAGFGAAVQYAVHLLYCVLPVAHILTVIVNYVWVRMAKMWAGSICVAIVKAIPGN